MEFYERRRSIGARALAQSICFIAFSNHGSLLHCSALINQAFITQCNSILFVGVQKMSNLIHSVSLLLLNVTFFFKHMKNSTYIFSSFGYFQKVRVFEVMFEIPEIKQTNKNEESMRF